MSTTSPRFLSCETSTSGPLRIALVAVFTVVFFAASVIGAGPVRAQATYTRPADYNFFPNQTFSEGGGTHSVPKNWNLFGGPVGLPYYIHADVIAAGYESAVRQAFQTMEDDPGSDVSFVYRGSTQVLSEIRIINGSFSELPQDDFNVVSFGRLPGSAIGNGGFSGSFNTDGSGNPLGSGDGYFDVTLSSSTLFATGVRSGAIDVESLVLHELGHAIGLDHPTVNSATVMWDTLNTGSTRRALHPADSAGLAALYPSSSAQQPALCNGQAPTLFVTAGRALVGTSGNDVILGTSGADVIDGGAGNDTICAGAGNDSVAGGSGNDTILGGSGSDYLRGQTGEDLVDGGDGDDRLLGGIDGDTISGGAGDDFIGGFGGDDIIDGGPGNERIFGGFGGDVIDGGAGNDEIHGLVGDDIITGGLGNDRLYGERGNDTVNGGGGNDLILGGNADDVLNGDSGNDEVRGGKADDSVRGGSGTDVCVGNAQNVADTAFSDCETRFGFP